MSLRSSPLKLGNKSTLTNNFLKTEISDITCKRPIWLNNKNIINLLILCLYSFTWEYYRSRFPF